MTRINKHPTEEFDASGSIRLVQQAGEAVNLGSSAATATDKDGNDVSTTLLDQTTLRVTSDPDGGANNALTVLVRGAPRRRPRTGSSSRSRPTSARSGWCRPRFTWPITNR